MWYSNAGDPTIREFSKRKSDPPAVAPNDQRDTSSLALMREIES